MPSLKRVPRTFRIAKFHKLMLETEPYNQAPGELIYILLEELFSGKLPKIEARFKQILATKKAK